MSSFTSIAEPVETLFKEKSSKFFAYAYPVKDLEEINIRLEELKKHHPKARHHCYAYRLGADNSIFKANDAGEPSNSAGMPILNQIRSAELTNILVVVVRYFGGTKLGLPGLINAYKTAAADVIKIANLAEDFEKEHLTLQTTYPKLSELKNFLKKNDVEITGQQFGEMCILHVTVAAEKASLLKEEIVEMNFTEILK